MKVLVTGGSGFIGSHVVDQVMAAGHEARNFDLYVSPYLNGHPFENALGDLRSEDDVRAAVSGCDVIIHLAAMADVDQVAKDPTRTEQVNARGTHVLLEAARQEGISRFVYASTIWVYGDATGPEQIDEDTPLPLPKHFYTATKIAGEMYVRSYGELYGLEHTILRFGIPYGPRARPTAVVPAFVAKALGGQPLTIAGDGTQSRRFVYVEDLAAGVVAALQPGGREPHLQPGRAARTSASARSPGRCATWSGTCRSSTSRAGPLTCAARTSRGPVRATSSAGSRRRASPTVCAATSTG